MSFLPGASGRLVVMSFRGWNDAADAASDTARHLVEEWGLELAGILTDEAFYDYTVMRPLTVRDEDGKPELVWPACSFYRGTVPGTALEALVIIGFEPNFRWQEFAGQLCGALSAEDRVVLLGALLADVPHVRPLPVSTTSEDAELVDDETVFASEYEGPSGITGVLSTMLLERAIPTVSQWVAVPAYAGASPSPKAVLALLSAFEDVTGLVVAQRALTEEARAWETGTDALVAEDEDLAEHVEALAGAMDASELPEASGEVIAREFERYLERRRRDGGK